MHHLPGTAQSSFADRLFAGAMATVAFAAVACSSSNPSPTAPPDLSADVLQSGVRAGDKVGRFGGEEFVVLLPGASPTVVYAVAERLRVGVERLRINLDGPIVGVTVSIGGAVFPLDGDNVTDVMQYADMNLYQVKRHGRNRVAMSHRAEHPSGGQARR